MTVRPTAIRRRVTHSAVPKERTMPKKLLPKVTSLRDLSTKAASDERYQRLAIAGASNLGALSSETTTWEKAVHALETHAFSLEAEYGEADGEKSVIEEVNYVRDCI